MSFSQKGRVLKISKERGSHRRPSVATTAGFGTKWCHYNTSREPVIDLILSTMCRWGVRVLGRKGSTLKCCMGPVDWETNISTSNSFLFCSIGQRNSPLLPSPAAVSSKELERAPTRSIQPRPSPRQRALCV